MRSTLSTPDVSLRTKCAMLIPRLQIFTIAAAALLGATSIAHAAAVTVDFNSFSLGDLPGGADVRTAGNGNTWYVPDNAATYGRVVAGIGRGGSQGLEVGNRGNGNDGVIDNIKSGKLAQAAGESTTGAPNRVFESSFYFRSVQTTGVPTFRFRTESWGSDRTTFLGFASNSNGNMEARAFGIDATGNFVATDLSTTLDWARWYRVQTTILFVDGVANDMVEFSIFNDLNALVGSTIGSSTWEQGQRLFGYNGGNQVAVDAIGFHARGSAAGATVYIDDVSWSSSNRSVPEPGALALVLTAGLAAFGATRRRRS